MELRNLLRLLSVTARSDIVEVPLRLFSPRVRAETVAMVEGEPELIVDLFTGAGSVLLEYARRFPRARIITVDKDLRALSVAEKRLAEAGYVDLEALAADARNLPLSDAEADLVNISFGLHEVPSSERRRILAECFRVLGGGGQLIVTDYAKVEGKGAALMWPYFRLFEPPWIGEILGGELEREVEATGFEVDEVRLDVSLARIIRARRPHPGPSP